MEQQIEQEKVTYLMHESDMARSDRKNKRLWITLNVLIAGIVTYGVIRICQSNR